VAKLRVLLDEDVRADVKSVFPSKVHVDTIAELGLSGMHDKDVVEQGIARKALIITANKDFVPQYRDHEWRRGKDGRHFWGLIFLVHSTSLSQIEQVRLALKKFNSKCDDILRVSPAGTVTTERLWE